VFTNFYATGTRTVRGMEALALCVPPTPGQSIVRRPRNGDLFSVGALFQARGYDTAFVYSGYGYFDNMNAFFSANGYRVVDRATVAKSDITYATVWGACDEDLYRWTLREADAAYAAGRPFHHFVMTTSNHRPFGFPDGCIDLPGGTRDAAVKYTDYAIGKLLEAAREKPWFTNTLFVIVGDHCASAAGKTALPIPGYHIPAFIWNPNLVAPRKLGTLCSQIDLLPTVFGLLDWSYNSRFYGRDILRMTPADERAFIATYQRLGYFRNGRLAILEPVKRQRMFTFEWPGAVTAPVENDPAFLAEAIAQYQTASWLFKHGLNRKDHAP
jgi:phosphoglycerol transferase MdoB-like AlkP superfamily enzyme